MEKRHNYVRKVAETAVQLFVSNDKVNVAGMVLAGSADFKTELSQSDMFDPVSLFCFACDKNPGQMVLHKHTRAQFRHGLCGLLGRLQEVAWL